ncbi:MAG: UDP-N-acetylmuramate:L-alanyl-gamma-D-glutamyl-meso-diaminopimelate ligase, partial [Gammaproteobacteria bacterium]
AFFDKRSKFVHYHSRTLVLNNLEFDHADIFSDLDAIKTQFHHLVRTIPGNGLILLPNNSDDLTDVLEMGCWTPCETTGGECDDGDWQGKAVSEDFSRFEVLHQNSGNYQSHGTVSWELIGAHNMMNGLAAIAAARHVGVPVEVSIDALAEFKSVKRRMELKGIFNGISVYDDFAHHPTAIEATLSALRSKVGPKRIIAVTDLRSNTMKSGIHRKKILPALEKADFNLIHKPQAAEWEFNLEGLDNISVKAKSEQLLDELLQWVKPGDHILFMSNGSFDGIQQKFLDRLSGEYGAGITN